MLPIYDKVLWYWPWEGLTEGTALEVALQLLPLLLGIAAWFVLALRRRRLRGALLLALCVGAILAPIGSVLGAPRELSFALNALSGPGGFAVLAVLGCVLIPAGNRQQKRTLGRGIGSWLASLGGVMVVAFFVYPSVPATLSGGWEGSHAPGAFFFEAEAWRHVSFVLLWLLGLFVFGLLGASSAIAVRLGDRFAARTQDGISTLARLLPLALPLIILGPFLWNGQDGFGFILLLVLKLGMQGYAVVLLATIGLARWLDDAEPDAVWEGEDDEHETPA